MAPAIVLLAALLPPLLIACLDLRLCVSFYREANRGAGPSRAVGGARPRSLSPDQVTLRHAFLFLFQKANYYWQLVTAFVQLARLYLFPKRTTDRDVALLMISTSLVTWVHASRREDGVVLASLRFEGFAFPLLPGRFDNLLVVESELMLGESTSPADRVVEARTLRFEFNGVPIDSVREQLSILAMMISSVTHPVVHSFNNRLYESHADPRLHDYDDLFLHGQYLNWCAWFWPGVMFRIPSPRGHHWYKRVLEFNAELPLPRHGHASLGLLAPFSRSVRFLLGARPVLARLHRRYGLPVDGESLFLCTILHAVDHVSCDEHTRGHILKNERLPDTGLFNLIALLFYRPAQHFWTNLLKDKRDRNPFYGELYTELRALDPGLADQVTLSISY